MIAAAPLTLGSSTALAIMVTEPALTARTNPAESTVAMVSLLEVHVHFDEKGEHPLGAELRSRSVSPMRNVA